MKSSQLVEKVLAESSIDDLRALLTSAEALARKLSGAGAVVHNLIRAQGALDKLEVQQKASGRKAVVFVDLTDLELGRSGYIGDVLFSGAGGQANMYYEDAGDEEMFVGVTREVAKRLKPHKLSSGAPITSADSPYLSKKNDPKVLQNFFELNYHGSDLLAFSVGPDKKLMIELASSRAMKNSLAAELESDLEQA